MRKIIKSIFLTIFIWLALSAISTVNAATATIKANKTSVKVGDSVKVTVTVKAAAWNLKVSGDAKGDIIGYNADAENETTTKTYDIDTSKEGTYKVVLSGDITDESKDTADSINTSVSITVKPKETTTSKDTTTDKNTNKDTTTEKKEETTTPEKPKEKSNNANLSTLGITPKEYDFSGFSKNKTSYSVTIPKNIDSVKVLYKTADANAKVKVSGNTGFKVGSDNKITIKVTAEDGKTTKTYTIKVTQLAEEEEKPGNVIEDASGLYLTKLYIDAAQLSPEFSSDIYSYTAELNDPNISDLLVETEANNENAKIDISGHKNLVEGENTVNIILTMDDSDIQTVYQVVVTAHFTDEVIESSSEENVSNTDDFIGTIKKYASIAIGVVVFIVVVVIVLIIMLIKENKKIKEDDEYEETPKRNSRRENNYIEEFGNNDIQRDNFIESLYKQRNGELDEDLTDDEKETLEEISKQTEKIFEEKVEGQSVEYISNEIIENPLEKRKRRRGKGKHSL